MPSYKVPSVEPMKETDFEDFCKITLHDPMLERYLSLYVSESEEMLKEKFDDILGSEETELLYKISDGEDKIVGWIKADIRGNGDLSLEYFVGKDYRRCGYMTTALEEFSQISKAKGYFALEALIEPENEASRMVVKTLGWKERPLKLFGLSSSMFTQAW